MVRAAKNKQEATKFSCNDQSDRIPGTRLPDRHLTSLRSMPCARHPQPTTTLTNPPRSVASIATLSKSTLNINITHIRYTPISSHHPHHHHLPAHLVMPGSTTSSTPSIIKSAASGGHKQGCIACPDGDGGCCECCIIPCKSRISHLPFPANGSIGMGRLMGCL